MNWPKEQTKLHSKVHFGAFRGKAIPLRLYYNSHMA